MATCLTGCWESINIPDPMAMIPLIIALIGLPEIGWIVGVAVILFGCKAVSRNPFISRGQKILWMLTIVALNWIGLLWYYYTFYMKDK